MKKISGNIFEGNQPIECELSFDSKFISIKKISSKENPELPLIIPGFIDLHIHGGGGADVMEAGDAIYKIAETHSQFGTSSFLATTMTAPIEELEKSFLAMKDFYQNKPSNAARLLGVHLEGPYISSEKLGAQPNFVKEATLQEIKFLNEIVPIKIITLAPEIFNHQDLIQDLCAMGITVQLGHSNGSYEDGLKAMSMGAKSFTHLYNAMSPLHHRSPGMVGAALAHAEFAELIPDMLHVHPGAIKVAMRSIPNIYFVTDATAAAGMPDGDYRLGSNIVHKCLGGVRLKDGTLAGSSLTMDVAYLNLIQMGLSPHIASDRLSGTPAKVINQSDRGKLSENMYADFIVLNSDFTVKEVWIEGEKR